MSTHPKDAFHFCPFCGSKEFYFDNIKSHTCRDCGKKLYTNEVGAVVALIQNSQGRFLFTTRRLDPAKGMLDFPGGFIDLGETAEQAVVREVKEELHLDVKDTHFVASFPNTYPYRGLTYFTIDIVFYCAVDDFSPMEAADDVLSAQFLDIKDVEVESVGLTSIRNLVRKLKNEELFIEHFPQKPDK